MLSANGKSSPAKGLGTIEFVGPLTLGRLAFLISLGVLTYVLHKTFHYPLKMPGHHGLEAMALLVLGRLSCTNPFSATIVCLSALTTASFATGMGHDASSALLGLAPGLLVDAGVLLFKNWRAQFLVLPLLAALGHATKPLIRSGIFETTGINFGSLRHGLVYPLTTHFCYGLAGGLLAALLWRITVRRWNSENV
ncbi:MAG: hypothetical protein KDJ17_09700 [Hyphomicrobiaceae bacterium]|nr:hypothetical protein [Hyphomicrobiaceae bacterium]